MTTIRRSRSKRADRVAAAFYLAAAPDYWDRHEVTDYLDRNVSPILSSIDGVQRVGLEGGRDPALRIWLDTARLAAFNLSVDEVITALQSNNVVAAVGNLEGSQQKLNILTNASLQTVEDFKNLHLRNLDGVKLTLAGVAEIELGEGTASVDARDDLNKRVFLSIWPLPGANEIAIGDELYVMLDKINRGLPDGLEISIVYDSTDCMRSALKEIFKTLGETVFLVGIVILFMMGSIRVALVPLVAIPVSILGAILGMMVMGFTLNLLTILAIVPSVGLVVDDAIVVVENVARHKRAGKSGIQAALISSRTLFRPIIAMTFTLCAVFIPIGFIAGLSGALFREFAFTIAAAIAFSGVTAVVLSPLMSAYLTAGFESGKFLYVDTDLKIDLPIVRLEYDHQRLSDLGLTSLGVTNQLSALLSDRYVNRFDASGRAYEVIPMAAQQYWAEPRYWLKQPSV